MNGVDIHMYFPRLTRVTNNRSTVLKCTSYAGLLCRVHEISETPPRSVIMSSPEWTFDWRRANEGEKKVSVSRDICQKKK